MTQTLRSQIGQWLAREQDCSCGRTHAVHTRIVRFDDTAGRVVVDVLAQLGHLPDARTGRRAAPMTGCDDTVPATRRDTPAIRTANGGARGVPPSATILLASDTNTRRAAAAAIARMLREAAFNVVEKTFVAGLDDAVAADESTLAELDRAVRDCRPAALVGVGSGTINDLCKSAASERALTYIACPTAASMNGYTSAVASLKCGGLKTTQPVRAPDAVVVDLDVITRSPTEMTAAGVADLVSKFVCNADWRLAHLIEGDYYCDLPARMASDATDAVVRCLDPARNRDRSAAAGKRRRDPQRRDAVRRDVLETLIAALIQSGMSMAMAGSSSPASGGEHLISHYWDMCVPAAGHARLHGAQVGVGTILCATLYERLMQVDAASIDPDAVARSVEPFPSLERRLRRHFGSAADAVVEQARCKHLPPDAARRRAALIKDRWADLLRAVRPVLKTRDEVVAILDRVGAPVTLAHLGLSDRHGAAALTWARYIRNRYTVLDLAAQIGCFDDGHRRMLLRHSRVTAAR